MLFINFKIKENECSPFWKITILFSNKFFNKQKCYFKVYIPTVRITENKVHSPKLFTPLELFPPARSRKFIMITHEV